MRGLFQRKKDVKNWRLNSDVLSNSVNEYGVWIDEKGVQYSSDKKNLLKGNN